MFGRDLKCYDYFPVPLDDFRFKDLLQVDLYVPVEGGGFDKIGQAGERFILWDLQKIKLGEDVVYLTKRDYAFHVGFNIDLDMPKCKIAAKKYDWAMTQIQIEVESQARQLLDLNIPEADLLRAVRRLRNAVVIVAENPVTMKLLKKILDDEPLFVHSVTVSLLACLLADRLGWQKEGNFFKIALCGLLHDIGVANSPEPYPKKSWAHLSPYEREELRIHILRGANILRSVTVLPQEVATAAACHHEPITEDRDYWVEIVAVVNRFCELRDHCSGSSMQNILELLWSEKNLFSEDYLCKINELMNVEAAR